ncbi:MAG: hypothetical protein NVS3B16_15730 [Vulcanimicrobiaceae bacterium]
MTDRSSHPARVAAVALLGGLWLAAPGAAQAATAAAPAASPSPVAAAAEVTDPCTSLSNVVSRPTFGTAACAVKRGDLLIETGYTNATTSGSGANSLVTYPQASLRAGMGRNLEFDLNPTSIARLSGSPRIVGTTDSTIGLKYELGYTTKLVYGANVLYTLPTGDGPFTGNGDGILANLNAGLTLSPAFGLYASLGYNTQSAGTPDAPARYHNFQPSLGAALALPHGYNVLLEGFNQSSTAPGLGGRFGYDAAVQKGIGSRLQLDVNYFNYPGVQNGGHLHSIGFGAAYLIGS